jgi:hypothetical protein
MKSKVQKELAVMAKAEQEELDSQELAYHCTTLSQEEVVELYVSLARETGKLRQEIDYKF